MTRPMIHINNNLIMQSRAIVQGLKNSYRSLRVYLHKKYLPQRYIFHSRTPHNELGYWGIPREQYKADRQKEQLINPFLCLALFLLGMGVTDFVYSLRNNPKQSYRLYVMYPKICKMVDDVLDCPQLQPWFSLGQQMFVKSLPEYNNFWSTVHSNIWGNRQKLRAEAENQKISMLKQQFKEMDAKYPLPNTQKKQSVF